MLISLKGKNGKSLPKEQREELIKRHVVDWKTTPQEFIERCREINTQQVMELDASILVQKRARELHFALGMLDFAWI